MARLEEIVNGRIEIELTHPECKTVSIGLHATPRYKISPRPIVVRDVYGSGGVTKKVRIKNNYNDDFEVQSVRSKKGLVEAVGSRALKDGYELDLRITPPAQRGRASHFTDVVVVKLKNGRSLEIPCNGFYPRRSTISSVPITTTKKDEEECKTCGPVIF
jgi:hypothetical protein